MSKDLKPLTKEEMTERIVRRLAEHPEMIDELKDRLENDEIVDLEDVKDPPKRK